MINFSLIFWNNQTGSWYEIASLTYKIMRCVSFRFRGMFQGVKLCHSRNASPAGSCLLRLCYVCMAYTAFLFAKSCKCSSFVTSDSEQWNKKKWMQPAQQYHKIYSTHFTCCEATTSGKMYDVTLSPSGLQHLEVSPVCPFSPAYEGNH